MTGGGSRRSGEPRAPGEPRRPRPTRPALTARALRRRTVRRRRLVAVVALCVVVAIAVAAVTLGRGSGDAFAGTWSATSAGGGVVIAHVSGSHYTVLVGSAHTTRPAVRSGDRLTVAAASSAAASSAAAPVAAASSATPGVIVLKPGPGSGTLEEWFADGTSSILPRGG